MNLQWLVTDQLGTPRMIYDKTGSFATTKRHDYLPFGEEISAFGGRTIAQGYNLSDGIRQQFTGYERDAETGLDYAHARYDGSVQGRFLSVDPLMASASVTNPQSLNRYTYCLNNPVNLTDPSGMMTMYDAGMSYSDVFAAWAGEDSHYGGFETGRDIIANGMNGFLDRQESEDDEPSDAGKSGHTGGDEGKAGSEGVNPQKPEGGVGQAVSFQTTYAQLPSSGTGYYRSGRARVEYGNLTVIAKLIAFAAQWNQDHPDHDIGIGEMSDSRGRSVRPHHSHRNGLRVDIRPMRNDSLHAGVTWNVPGTDRLNPDYNQDLTIELITGLRALPHVRNILFNDPATVGKSIIYWDGHDNHLHVNFTAGW